MVKDVLDDAKQRMTGAIKSLEHDLDKFRTGRANPALLEDLVVEVYGAELPLKQVGLVSVPEPQQLAIRPFDQNALTAIERAILKSDLSLTPNNDGKIIRINIPRLTEDRRRQMVKLVGKRIEEARISVRNVRRDAISFLRDLEKDKEITEDDKKYGEDEAQKLTDKFIEQINELGTKKEAEVMEV